MIEEFRKFIAQGNALDLAVGVIIGAAFGKIVSSFVTDLFTPLLGLVLGGVNFSSLGIVLKEGVNGAEPVIFAYGKFIQSVFDFFIIAVALFFMIKAINKFRQQKEEVPSAPPEDVVLLSEIRDILKSDKGK